MGAHSFHIVTPFGSLYFSQGNSKVGVPIFNVGAATDCPHVETCSFSHPQKGDWRKGVCYAQKTERMYPSVLAARRKNEEVIRLLNDSDTVFHASRLADYMAKVCRKRSVKNIRLNESSDLADWNIKFLEALVKALIYRGIRPYGYSKSSLYMRELLTAAGAVILESEVDFVAIDEVIPHTDMTMCPGIGCGVTCGMCQSSTSGTIYILKH